MNSRRKFLLQSSALVADVICGPSLMLRGNSSMAVQSDSASNEYFLIGDGSRGRESLFGKESYSPRPGLIKIWRFGQKHIQQIELPFFPHSFTSNPVAPYRVITFEKWGRQLAEVDLLSMKVVRISQAESGRRFFGHGAHAGNLFYATQMDDELGRGLVSVMDSETHRVVREIETHGVFPHDCQWFPGMSKLLVMNSRHTYNQRDVRGNHSGVVWLDTRTGTCDNQVFIKTPEFGYAHFAQSTDGFIVAAGSFDTPKGNSQPLLSVIRPDDSTMVLESNATSLRGEALSLYLNEENSLVVATLPGSSKVQIWNYKTGEFIRQIALGEPRGLAYSTVINKLLVSSALTGHFMALNKQMNAWEESPCALGMGGRGSHLVRIKIV